MAAGSAGRRSQPGRGFARRAAVARRTSRTSSSAPPAANAARSSGFVRILVTVLSPSGLRQRSGGQRRSRPCRTRPRRTSASAVGLSGLPLLTRPARRPTREARTHDSMNSARRTRALRTGSGMPGVMRTEVSSASCAASIRSCAGGFRAVIAHRPAAGRRRRRPPLRPGDEALKSAVHLDHAVPGVGAERVPGEHVLGELYSGRTRPTAASLPKDSRILPGRYLRPCREPRGSGALDLGRLGGRGGVRPLDPALPRPGSSRGPKRRPTRRSASRTRRVARRRPRGRRAGTAGAPWTWRRSQPASSIRCPGRLRSWTPAARARPPTHPG